MDLKYITKQYGNTKKMTISIPWATFRANTLDEYYDLESKKDENFPNHWGYIFTPDCAYEVRPENIYIWKKHRYVVKDELIKHEYKDMKNMTYDDPQLGKINVSQLLIDKINGQFRFWSSAQYHTGKKWADMKDKCTKLL